MGQIFILFYFCTLVVSLVYFKKYVDTPLRFFPLLIAYTLFNEALGYFIMSYEEFTFFEEDEYNWHNIIIYNIYQVVFFAYLFWLYHQLITSSTYKMIISIGGLLTILAYIFSAFIQDPFHTSLFYADTLGSVLIVLTIVLHFSTMKKLTRYNLMMWINLGMLIFYVYLPFDVLNAYLNEEFYLENNLRHILWVLIYIMYGLFMFGFIISKRSAFR